MVKTPSTHKAHLSSTCHCNFRHSNNICKSKFWHLHFILQWSSLCLVFRAKIFLDPVDALSSSCVFRRQFLERKIDVRPHNIHTLRTSNTLRFTDTNNINDSQIMSPCQRTNSMTRKKFLIRNGQVTPTPQKEPRAVHFQHFLQLLQISFMTIWTFRIGRVCKRNLPAVVNHLQKTICMDQDYMEILPSEWNFRDFASHQEPKFLKN